MTATATAPGSERRWQRLTRPFGQPLHPMIASVAIGCWAASVAFDAVSHVSDTEFVYVRGAYLLTAVGVAAAVVASLLGLADLLDIDRDDPAFTVGMRHLLAMDAALVLFTISFLVRRTADFGFHESTAVAATALSLLGGAALIVGLWWSGRLVHDYGVGDPLAVGDAVDSTTGAADPGDGPTDDEE